MPWACFKIDAPRRELLLRCVEKQTETIEYIRRRLEHEDNLVNHRLSWILTSQAFLLTGYAILLNAPLGLRTELLAKHHELLMKLIPFVGIATVVLIWVAILGALFAMRHLRLCALEHPGPDSSRIHGTPATRVMGMAAPVVIPLLFLVVWLVVVAA